MHIVNRQQLFGGSPTREVLTFISESSVVGAAGRSLLATVTVPSLTRDHSLQQANLQTSSAAAAAPDETHKLSGDTCTQPSCRRTQEGKIPETDIGSIQHLGLSPTILPINDTSTEHKTITTAATDVRYGIVQILGRRAERRLFPLSANIFMSIKTSSRTDSRLPPILLTWMQTIIPKQVKEIRCNMH